jgi:hypothetical protein
LKLVVVTEHRDAQSDSRCSGHDVRDGEAAAVTRVAPEHSPPRRPADFRRARLWSFGGARQDLQITGSVRVTVLEAVDLSREIEAAAYSVQAGAIAPILNKGWLDSLPLAV